MSTTTAPKLRISLSKVPEVSAYFWIIKVLCTTVGETFADWVNGKLGDSLTKTTLVMGSLLVVALIAQFRTRRYVPGVYWVAVVLLSIVGTLITDNMAEGAAIVRASDSVIIYVTAQFARLFGYAPAELVGQHASVLNAETERSPEDTARTASRRRP